MLGTWKKKGSSEFWNYLFEMNLDDNCEKKKCWECNMIGNEEGSVFNCTRSIGDDVICHSDGFGANENKIKFKFKMINK